MREAAGQNIKSALSHCWVRDTRNDRLIGTRGAYMKLSQELAGLGGDAFFYKTEAHAQLARPLIPGVVRRSSGAPCVLKAHTTVCRPCRLLLVQDCCGALGCPYLSPTAFS